MGEKWRGFPSGLYFFFLQTSKAGLQRILNFCELVTEWHFSVILVFIILSMIWPDVVVSMLKAFFLWAILQHIHVLCLGTNLAALDDQCPQNTRATLQLCLGTKCCTCLALKQLILKCSTLHGGGIWLCSLEHLDERRWTAESTGAGRSSRKGCGSKLLWDITCK